MKSSSRLPLFALLLAGAAVFLWWVARPDSAESQEDGVAAAQVAGAGKGRGGSSSDKPKLPRQSALELQEAPKASIAGVVRTAGGKPLLGARVCAFVVGQETTRPREAPCVASTVDGRFRIEGLLAARYDVTASAAQHLPGRFEPGDSKSRYVRVASGQQRTGVEIALQPGGVQVFGTVRDISGGEIALAQVTSGRNRWFGDGNIPTSVITDEEGAFSMWVEEGNVSLKADAEGYAAETQRGRAPGTHYKLFLTPESVVVGRVVDVATGDPVPGALVRVDRGPPVLSEEDGSFRIEGLAPGVYKPTVKADAGYGEAETSVHLGLGETSKDVLVRLHPAVTVSGVVVIKDGEEVRPCERGSAMLRRVPNAGGSVYSGSVRTEGEVRMKGVLPGRYEVTASCTGYLSEDAYGEIDVADTPVEGLRWEVTTGASIRGKVVVAEAEQLRGLQVRARSTGGEARGKGGWASTGKFDEDGTFVLEGLSANTYKLTASGRGVPEPEEPLEVVVPQGEVVEGVELELLPEAIIRGQVQDEAGNPVTAADVRAEGPGRNWSAEQVGDDGRFELRGLRGGEYRVRAALNWSDSLRKPGTTDDDVQGEAVTVDAGDEAEVLLVVEARDGTISGTVTDSGGGPVSDAFIRAERLSDSKAANTKNTLRRARWGGWNDQPIMTDTEGGFTVEGLSEGAYTVWAVRKGGGEGYAENVSSGADGVSIQLQPTGQILGTVTAASGGAPQRFKVTVNDETTGFSRRESFFATDGRFVIDEMPPGKFFVAASSTEGSGDTEVTLAEGASQAGVKVELQKMVAVKGRVVDLESGEPIPGISVSMNRKKSRDFNISFGGGDKRNITDDNGTYELDAVPVGHVSVILFPKDFGGDSDYSFSQTRAVVEDGNPFEVPALEMIKRRVKKQEDTGDLGYTLKESAPDVDWMERELIVGFVRPGGPAAQAGLKVGAKIESVDGHDVTKKPARYSALSRIEVGATLELGIEGGATVKITAVKKP
ncbi:MAG: carboxypeptidase regulatory-like domain-containing protein [Nannocystales bacterium]